MAHQIIVITGASSGIDRQHKGERDREDTLYRAGHSGRTHGLPAVRHDAAKD